MIRIGLETEEERCATRTLYVLATLGVPWADEDISDTGGAPD